MNHTVILYLIGVYMSVFVYIALLDNKLFSLWGRVAEVEYVCDKTLQMWCLSIMHHLMC